MNNLKKYAGLLNDAAPENHLLAYITPQERDMLVDAGGVKTPTPSGIFAYPPLGQAGTSPGTTTSGGSAFSGGGGGGGGGQDYSSVAPSAPTYTGGGGQDMSTVSVSPPSIGNENDGRLNYLTGDYLDINLTPEQKEQFQDYQKGVSEAISPSSKMSNKIISGLLNTAVFPFAGDLYSKYLDATAMGYSIPNPFEGFFDGDSITPETIKTFQDKGSDEQQALINSAVSKLPYAMTGTIPQDSVAQQFFNNMNTTQGSPLSSDLQTDYNNAKNSVNSILGITPTNQQFGYSTDPYSGLMASNLTTNPYNIDYLKRLGLI